MKEQLITFETAKLAKEKGFDVPVQRYFSGLGQHDIRSHEYLNFNNDVDTCYSKPTQSLLQKWLRERYQLHIEIYVQLGFKHYSFSILPKEVIKYTINYKTYEQALEKGLEKALELITI